MAVLAAVVSVALSLVFTPFLMFILCIIFLASIGKSLGVRRLYVNILLKIFEYGRQHIEVARKLKRDERSTEPAESVSPSVLYRRPSWPQVAPDKTTLGITGNGHATTGNGVGKSIASVIRREDLILVPDPGLNYKKYGSQERLSESPDSGSLEEKDFLNSRDQPTDFELSDCLDYVKAGMEAIIEDQVTSVFEAEELRSWNLLTRTNSHYEFVSWRLTIIWMFGFFVRYFFLLPLRILICFLGISYMIVAFAIVGRVPEGRFKHWLSDITFKMAFRILARSLSCVLTFHNLQYKPKKCGFCVANHTSPIDVVMMSSETCFSLVWWLILCTGAVGYLPDIALKRSVNRFVSAMCFETLSRSISAVITYHDTHNRPASGICVANHTSPIDVAMLMCDNCYSLIGQSHSGFLGLLQRALARASPHIWFERSEAKDRHAVAKRLKEHISDPNNPPILIFPEGTCINNTSVMQFKKGSFEVGGVIYPVAIKYDPRFGDAFWNSSRYGMVHYLYMMMSSWAIVCDVWYLPPMYQQPGESAIDFANRVKSVIAKQGGLVDLMWDGQLKRMKPKKEWKELQQEEFSKRLKAE